MQTSPLNSFKLFRYGCRLRYDSGAGTAFADCGKQEIYQDGEALVTWDDKVSIFFLVLEGKCEIRTTMNDLLYSLGRSSSSAKSASSTRSSAQRGGDRHRRMQAIRFPASLLNDLEARRPEILAKLLMNISVVLCQKLRSTTRFAEAPLCLGAERCKRTQHGVKRERCR